MSRVYDNVPRRWADHNEGRSKYSSKTGNRCSFSGRVFYSYGTPVAVYHTSPDNAPFVLASDFKYSPSTGSHISAAVCAAAVLTFRVPRIGAHGGWNHEPLTEDAALHVHNAAAMADNVLAKEAVYARRWRHADAYGEDYMVRHITTMVGDLEQYCKVTGTPLPAKYEGFLTVIQRLREGWSQAKARYDDPKAVKKRERARARRLAAEVLEY